MPPIGTTNSQPRKQVLVSKWLWELCVCARAPLGRACRQRLGCVCVGGGRQGKCPYTALLSFGARPATKRCDGLQESRRRAGDSRTHAYVHAHVPMSAVHCSRFSHRCRAVRPS